ncbi:hypothetical protein MAR_009512 [Mya arenaria]|uniref:Uncharacterized protein n=1 Tax=Mya arenaria TaxID=6604 RepID=A0ABY7E356_MYAAR|nr:uncharacterized protein LOC128230508 [Mya arenaria]XP_052802154.1 uncharacterized protein LOC128232558 [Mya arenaria]WAR02941.1 hypothetical protein MAR_009499 [Mya arenaria]WAR02954.1 hypothetical protein MAR_009512 [Mya arenaria]
MHLLVGYLIAVQLTCAIGQGMFDWYSINSFGSNSGSNSPIRREYSEGATTSYTEPSNGISRSILIGYLANILRGGLYHATESYSDDVQDTVQDVVEGTWDFVKEVTEDASESVENTIDTFSEILDDHTEDRYETQADTMDDFIDNVVNDDTVGNVFSDVVENTDDLYSNDNWSMFGLYNNDMMNQGFSLWND